MKKRILSMLLVLSMVLSTFMTVALSASDSKLPFEDVPDKWYKEAVTYVFEKGFMKGLTNTEFGPERNMTRAQFVTLLSRFAGLTDEDIKGMSKHMTFADTSATAWYADYVGWSVQAGLVGGYENNTFRPDNYVSRAELAKLMVCFLESEGITVKAAEPIGEFKDKDTFASWAAEYIEKLRLTGLVKGIDGYYKPNNTTTRAEIATIMMRLDKMNHDVTDPMYEAIEAFPDKYECAVHNKVDMTLGFASDFTSANIAAILLKWMELDPAKYSIIMDEEAIDEMREEYQNQGIGCGTGGDVWFKVKNNVSGEETEELSEDFAFNKFPDCVGVNFCHENETMYDAVKNITSLLEMKDGRIVVTLTSTDVNHDAIARQIVEGLGLPYGFYGLDISNEEAFLAALTAPDGDFLKAGHGSIIPTSIPLEFKVENLYKKAFYNTISTEDNPTAGRRDLTDAVSYELCIIKNASDEISATLPASGTEFVFDGEPSTDTFNGWLLAQIAASGTQFDEIAVSTPIDTLIAAYAALEEGASANVDVDVVLTASETANNPAGIPAVTAERTYSIRLTKPEAAPDPMVEKLENITDIALTDESGSVFMQFKNKDELTSEGVSRRLMPQLGLDSATYELSADISEETVNSFDSSEAGSALVKSIRIKLTNNATGKSVEKDVSCAMYKPDEESFIEAMEALSGKACKRHSAFHMYAENAEALTYETFVNELSSGVGADYYGISGQCSITVSEAEFQKITFGETVNVLIDLHDIGTGENVYGYTMPLMIDLKGLVSGLTIVPFCPDAHVVPDDDPEPDNIGVLYNNESHSIKISYVRKVEDNSGSSTEAIPVTSTGTHGGHETKLLRTQQGTYAVYVTGEKPHDQIYVNNNTFTWDQFTVVKITDKGSKIVFQDWYPHSSGSCVPNIIGGVNGTAYITLIAEDKEAYLTSWDYDNGRYTREAAWLNVYELDTASGKVVAQHLAKPDFPRFGLSGYGYSQPILDTVNGKIYALYTAGDVPGYLAWFTYDVKTGTWSDTAQIVETDWRCAYFNGYADGNGGFYVVAERDCKADALASKLGVTLGSGATYIWDACYIFHIQDASRAEVDVKTVYEPQYTADGSNPRQNVSHYNKGDTFLDSDGNLHIIYTVTVKNRNNMFYAIYDRNLNEIKNAPITLTVTNDRKISYCVNLAEDSDGNMYIFAIYAYASEKTAKVEIWKSADGGMTYNKIVEPVELKVKTDDGNTDATLSPSNMISSTRRNFSLQDNVVGILIANSNSTGLSDYYYFSIELPGND